MPTEPALFAVVAILAAAVGASGAIVANLISERAAAKRHREQTARDDRLHRERIEREDRHRFLNDRRQVYAGFMAAAKRILVRVGKTQNISPLLDEADSYFQQVCLIAPIEVAGWADKTWGLVTHLAANPPAPDAPPDQPCQIALNAFGAAARKDLLRGVPMERPESSDAG